MIRVPTIDVLNEYWEKTTSDKLSKLVGRLNGVIAGTYSFYMNRHGESRKYSSTRRHFAVLGRVDTV